MIDLNSTTVAVYVHARQIANSIALDSWMWNTLAHYQRISWNQVIRVTTNGAGNSPPPPGISLIQMENSVAGYKFLATNSYELPDGRISFIPPDALASLGSVGHLPYMDGRFSAEMPTMGIQPDFNTARLEGMHTHIPVSHYGAISFLGAEDLLHILPTLGKEKVKVIEVKGLFTSGVTHEPKVVEVRKAQIVSRARFFAYESDLHVYDFVTKLVTIKRVVRIGTFINMKKMLERAQSVATVTKIFADLITNAVTLFGLAALKQQVSDKSPQLLRFYPTGVLELYAGRAALLPITDHAEIAAKNKGVIDQNQFCLLSSVKDVYSSEAARKHRLVSRAGADAQQALKTLEQVRIDDATTLANLIKDQARLKEMIAGSITRAGAIESRRESDLQKVTLQKDIVNTNAKYLLELSTKLQEAMMSSPKSDAGVSWYKRFVESGIQIHSVLLSHSPTGLSVNAEKNPMLLADPDYTLQRIDFSTTRPSKIIVDNGKNGIRAGGPYYCELICSGRPQLWLRPASAASIIGYRIAGETVDLKWHPHTNIVRSIRSSIEEHLSTPMTACLGEAEPAIMSAVTNKDLRTIMLTCKLWLEQANSVDDWGKWWPWFPEWDKVYPDGDYKYAPETSQEEPEEDMDELLNTIVNNATAPVPVI